MDNHLLASCYHKPVSFCEIEGLADVFASPNPGIPKVVDAIQT
jgi:hypothetical protein